MPLGIGNKHARVTVELCRLVYEYNKSRETIQREICGLLNVQSENISWFDIKDLDTQAMIVNTRDTIYLAFPGTDSFFDALVDFVFDLVPYMDGHCHHMFLKVSQETFKQIGQAIKSDLGSKRVVITGHSLGGALAMLYAALFKNENAQFPVEYLITYGQPRCGNKNFTKAFGLLGINYVRFLNLNDIVPDVPMPLGKSDWSHAGRGLIFDNGKIRDTSDSDEASVWNRFWNLVIPILSFLIKEKKIDKDSIQKSKAFHNMNLYKENILKHFPEA